MIGLFESHVERLSEAGPPATVQDGLHLYTKASEFWLSLQDGLVDLADDPARRSAELKAVWNFRGRRWAAAAQALAYYILQNKQPPTGGLKAVQAAAKPFVAMKADPRNPGDWIADNGPKFLSLLMTREWGTRDNTSNLVLKFGDLTVHNNEGLGELELEAIRKLVMSSQVAIRQSGIPHTRDILYGDLVLTANLRGSANTAAWYKPDIDSIWLRPTTKYGPAEIKSLVHEFGHRLWDRFLPADVKRAWRTHDSLLRSGGGVGAITYPNVGDPLPFQVSGKGKAPPVVLRREPDPRTGGIKFYISDRGFVTNKQIRDFYADQSELLKFPTAYSRTNFEEHFCEAFALRVLNTLAEPHLSKFREIVG